ncbi:MAG: DUF2516 family protein [Mycobacteriales bacterium]
MTTLGPLDLILGPIEGLLGLVALGLFVLKIFAFVDAAIRPEPVWRAAVTQSKTFWLVLLALAVLFGGLGILGLAGLVAAIVYLVDVRPKLREVQGGGRPGGRGWR